MISGPPRDYAEPSRKEVFARIIADRERQRAARKARLVAGLRVLAVCVAAVLAGVGFPLLAFFLLVFWSLP